MKVLNRVQLIGNLGDDPQVTVFEKGNCLTKFPLATNDVYTNAKGEQVTETQWHNIVAWGKTAEIAEKILKKGNKVLIDGKLTNRTYENEKGEKKYITEVKANELLKLSLKE